MKTTYNRFGRPGYISYVMVIATGLILTLSTFYAFRRAINARDVQTKVQMRVDYSEKEDAILRSIVAITPNRAMNAMKHNSADSVTRQELRWRNIFSDALDMANARASISSDVIDQLAIPDLRMANVGDSLVTNTEDVFRPINRSNTNQDSTFCSSGMNTSLGTGFPVPLQSNDLSLSTRDTAYPIISNSKQYGSLAEGEVGLEPEDYPDYNLIPYPRINFGYGTPGELFVAKRNWWAFEMDLAGADRAVTRLTAPRRQFVLSIYEIPSQLAISSSAFLSLGRHASGEDWANVTIGGGVFLGKGAVEGSLDLSAVSSRRSMEISSNSTIGGETFQNDPFAPGTREAYQLTTGEFFPVSLASESGRVAFLPIQRGAEFFDRFAHSTESNTISNTTWNNYTIGALQCAMSLDITKVDPVTKQPTEFRFRAKPNIDFRQPIVTGITSSLPPGYTNCCQENESYDFGDQVVDVAYGVSGRFYFQSGVSGVVSFSNARFGDPYLTRWKFGYWRPAAPFKATPLPSGERLCVELFPQRMKAFLERIGASDPAINHSISVNVDYSTTGLNNPDYNPIQGGQYVEILPGNITNFGLILSECSDLSTFTKGFSIVSNLRTYIGDDFNTMPVDPPDDYTPVGAFYPPVSLFVPEKRFGVEEDPYSVNIAGQVGSLAEENTIDPIRPLDAKSVTGRYINTDEITVNLQPIDHPAALPPITMKNWLVVLEELRPEYTDD